MAEEPGSSGLELESFSLALEQHVSKDLRERAKGLNLTMGELLSRLIKTRS